MGNVHLRVQITVGLQLFLNVRPHPPILFGGICLPLFRAEILAD